MTLSAEPATRPAAPPAPARTVAPLPPAVVRTARPPLAATSLLLGGALLLAFVLHVTVVGQVVHARDQGLGHAQLREDLANAVVPVGVAPVGTPVALLEVPGTGLREVVREGSTSTVLASGPGHRRDTVLPGQPGTSVLLGRRAAFGGPFSGLESLRPGQEVVVTTGQGRHVFRVTGLRRAGDPLPAPPATGRLTLVTATGTPFLPSGVLRVDADLVTPVQPAPARPAVALTTAERALQGDSDALVPLLLLSQALLVAACGTAWARARWGARQAWVVGVPLLTLLGLGAAHAASRLLPNLL